MVGTGRGACLHYGSPVELIQCLTASEFFIGFFFFSICYSKVNRVAPQLWAMLSFQSQKNVQGLVNFK